MGLDINTKKLKKNAFRVSKVRGIGASRIRVPGGYLVARVLGMVQEIAEQYGNGYVHLTTRQGFEIEGIRLEDMEEINQKLQPIIEILEINQEETGKGYPASGTRNISACIGNNVCPFANYNTAALAKRIEKAVFPNDLHFKIACTGCSNGNEHTCDTALKSLIYIRHRFFFQNFRTNTGNSSCQITLLHRSTYNNHFV